MSHGLGLMALAVAVGLLGCWWQWRAEIRRAAAIQRGKVQECAAWRRQNLTPEAEKSLLRDLAAAEQRLREWRAAWMASKTEGAAGRGTPAEIYFELTAYVAECRARAERAAVRVSPGEQFGFATHAHTGPASDIAVVVCRQRRCLENLVGALLAAQPQALHAVQRERPETAAPSSRTMDGAEDFFEGGEPRERRLPEGVVSEAFRFEFTGTTATLRSFLNALAANANPVSVRGVAMSPETAVRAKEGEATWIAQTVARFTVSVECLLPAGGETL